MATSAPESPGPDSLGSALASPGRRPRANVLRRAVPTRGRM